MLKFSVANSKIKALKEVAELKPFLQKRKVYSFDLLSGWTCPFAKDCLSKVYNIDGKKSIVDGAHTQFRCFSASQEVAFPNVYNLRHHNMQEIQKRTTIGEMFELISASLPKDLGVCRIHVGGDFFSPRYFQAWCAIAIDNPDKLFYAYTKSLRYWLDVRSLVDTIPNLVLTASWGGRLDHLIEAEGLRSARVIMHPSQSNGLVIDHTDECAANPAMRDQDFALLIHGIQPAGSDASQSIKVLKQEKVQYAYNNR